ncbi:hypothetical protein MRB53_033752 [Persea americana]|uniref:Uncharacterized protein n=1 Tax=Persea americana TaxID=3435 RepID=A0ACC2KVW8_PERAE|nr:hypothetical protein MRB53_033752 [Persea americana]
MISTAMKCREQLVSESYEVEALSAVTATRFAEDLGLRHIILKGDCSKVIQALQITSTDLSPIGHLIEEVNDRLRSFQNAKISHT